MRITLARTILLTLCFVAPISAATKLQESGVKLGDARVYQSVKGSKKLIVTLVRLGQRNDGNLLINFYIPGHSLHKKSFVYHQKCETTRCDKIFFTQSGGKSIHLLSKDGYRGKHLFALLPEQSKPIPISYDKKLSKTASRRSIYENYLTATYQDRSPSEVNILLQDALKKVNQVCKAHAKLEQNISDFKKKSMLKLRGMGKPFLDALTAKCQDPMYQEVLKHIQKIYFLPATQHTKMTLTKMNALIIYLSPDLFNPSIVAKTDLDQL